MMSGRMVSSPAAAPGTVRSTAVQCVVPRKPCGVRGVMTSAIVRCRTGEPARPPSAAIRSASLRPSIPAAPKIMTCIRSVLFRAGSKAKALLF